jgi:hypothetical protein
MTKPPGKKMLVARNSGSATKRDTNVSMSRNIRSATMQTGQAARKRQAKKISEYINTMAYGTPEDRGN